MKKLLLSAALAMGLAAPAVSQAQDEVNTGALSLSGGVDYVTAYYFRGYNNAEAQLIIQPYATLSVAILESDDVSITGNFGGWASVHSQHAGGAQGDSIYFEQDYYAWLDFAFGDFVLSTGYNIYTYPGNAYEDSTELSVKVAYDDSALMEGAGVKFALKPYVLYVLELTGAGSGSADQDQYLEVGIAPSFSAAGNVTVTVPVNLGMSADGYYLGSDGGNETFGFWSVGVVGAVPLPIPTRYGTWSLSAGVTYIGLLADSAQASNPGDDYEIVGKVGISFSY